jgi:LytS/YehU family sensor histidine kinase
MPKMRDTSSTVGQEFDLVRAYLEIVKVRLANRLTCVIESPHGDLAGARVPAMLMLPLVDHAVANSVGEWHSMGSIDLRAAIVDGKIQFQLSWAGSACFTEDERIIAIRERLAAIYGGEASLIVQASGSNQTRAVLAIPHERAPVVERVRMSA